MLRFNEENVRFVEEGKQRYIEGYACVYDVTYFVPMEGFHERFTSGAFDKALQNRRNIEARYNHSKDFVLGSQALGTLEVWSDNKGLRYRIPFDANDPDHQKVRAKISSGIIKGSSMNFGNERVRFVMDGERAVCEVYESDVAEVGPVNNPCNLAATANIRSDEGTSSLHDMFERWKKTQEVLKRYSK